ncbi:MAG: Ribosomal protein [Chlamydiota bacterium]|jgi:ribosomal protein L29
MAKKKQKKQEESQVELKARKLELDREIFLLRNELALNRKLEKPHQLKATRRERARVLTLLTRQQKGVLEAKA